MEYIEELQAVLLRLHGVNSTHLETVPVTEEFLDQIVWKGNVEVFEVRGHPKAKYAYAWGFTLELDKPDMKYVTVLKIPPVDSPNAAVKAAIMSEIKNARKKQT